MALRQFPAAWLRSATLNSKSISFSAAANVDGDTSGPTAGAVPNAGGAPGGGSFGFWALTRDATAAPIKPSDACVKNFLHDFAMSPSERRIISSSSRAGSLPRTSCAAGVLTHLHGENRAIGSWGHRAIGR